MAMAGAAAGTRGQDAGGSGDRCERPAFADQVLGEPVPARFDACAVEPAELRASSRPVLRRQGQLVIVPVTRQPNDLLEVGQWVHRMHSGRRDQRPERREPRQPGLVLEVHPVVQPGDQRSELPLRDVVRQLQALVREESAEGAALVPVVGQRLADPTAAP